MQTYISILRGINITGYRIIKMDALRVMYEELGFVNVQTYIQSGNVLFQDEKKDLKVLEETISDAIKLKFGFDVPVIIKDIEEFKSIIECNPFLDDSSKDISKIYVTFLSAVPDMEKYHQIGQGQEYEEEFHLVNKAIFIYCPNGYGNTKLSTNFIENKLKVTATSRNWKTTLELLRMAEKLCSQTI
jgi:uncharacterized protein (DUF1697 family)